MSLFNRIITTGFGLFTKKSADLSFGLITKLRVDTLLKAGRWDDFESAIMELNSDDLTRLLDGLCLTNNFRDILHKYFMVTNSEIRELVAGTHSLFQAWESRTSKVGADLTEKQIEGFYHYLHEANKHLSHHFSTPVLEAESYARLVRVYMGFSETESSESAFRNATALIPNHLLAHHHYFKTISPKWLGNEETLRNFIENLAEGEIKTLMQLMFLVEMYSDIYYNSTLFSTTKFKQSYGALIEETLASVRIPANDTLIAIYIMNYLACLYKILGLSKQEAELNKQLDNKRTIYPWAYFGW